MDNEMIERVAEAVFNTDDFPAKTHYQRIAKNAIKAMREPTDKMVNAAYADVSSSFTEAWQIGIDAILND